MLVSWNELVLVKTELFDVKNQAGSPLPSDLLSGHMIPFSSNQVIPASSSTVLGSQVCTSRCSFAHFYNQINSERVHITSSFSLLFPTLSLL